LVTDIATGWEAHLTAKFPAAARGQEVDGVDLVLVDTYAAGCIQTFVDTGSLDARRLDVLRGCVDDLERALPSLLGDTSTYFARLLDLGRSILTKTT
jgi:hypothetical protein